MLRFRLIFILSVVVLHLSIAERRVLDGKTPAYDRRYVVYLIKANSSVLYDAWMCGGAIVSSWYIVTSAACVEDVKYMYAIAGYQKYVKYEDLNHDPCTSSYKKKIVYVCLPSEYDFDYPRVEKWANIDIALVKVESEYDFHDASYRTHCSYPPKPIEINYDPKLQEPGTNALVFGWGHTKKWRNTDDHRDYNMKDLLYGAVVLANKEECKKYFDEQKVKRIIDKYMICSMHEGNLDDSGGLNKPVDGSNSFKTSCAPGTLRLGDECIADLTYRREIANESAVDLTYRREIANESGADLTYRREIANESAVDLTYRREIANESGADLTYRREIANGSAVDARRRGICQNDHGGPLVSWRGPREVLIGIASVFRVQSSTKDCIPPFLYTSTHCNGAFLNCLMNEHAGKKAARCDALAKEGGFKIIRRSISWSMHPDGPAKNEIHSVARQTPARALRKTKDESEISDNIRERPLLKFEHLGSQ